MNRVWYLWFLLFGFLVIAAYTKRNPEKFNQHVLQETNSAGLYTYRDWSSPLAKPVILNISDCVYKCALRFLRCSATPDNPHGIALLDPLNFTWDRLADRKTIRLNGVINGTANRLSTLVINYVLVTSTSNHAKIVGNIPRLSLSGMYDVSGVLAGALPIFGSGPFSVELYNVSLVVTMTLRMYPNSGFYMSDFNVDFSPEYIEVSLGQLLGGGSLGATVQDFLQDAALQVLDRSRLLIQEDLRRTITAAADRSLAPLKDVAALVNFLVTFSKVTDTC